MHGSKTSRWRLNTHNLRTRSRPNKPHGERSGARQRQGGSLEPEPVTPSRCSCASTWRDLVRVHAWPTRRSSSAPARCGGLGKRQKSDAGRSDSRPGLLSRATGPHTCDIACAVQRPAPQQRHLLRGDHNDRSRFPRSRPGWLTEPEVDGSGRSQHPAGDRRGRPRTVARARAGTDPDSVLVFASGMIAAVSVVVAAIVVWRAGPNFIGRVC